MQLLWLPRACTPSASAPSSSPSPSSPAAADLATRVPPCGRGKAPGRAARAPRAGRGRTAGPDTRPPESSWLRLPDCPPAPGARTWGLILSGLRLAKDSSVDGGRLRCCMQMMRCAAEHRRREVPLDSDRIIGGLAVPGTELVHDHGKRRVRVRVSAESGVRLCGSARARWARGFVYAVWSSGRRGGAEAQGPGSTRAVQYHRS